MTDDDFAKMLELMFNSKLNERKIVKDLDPQQNVNYEICAECGGACCKRCGCEISPDDFENISFENLKAEIEKGYISIEFIDREIILEDRGVYVLRVRNSNKPIVDSGYQRGTGCILLTKTGCKLNYENRPTGGKLLIPSREIKSSFFGEEQRMCYSNYGIHDCCYEWRPYQKILHQLANYFKDKDFPCSI